MERQRETELRVSEYSQNAILYDAECIRRRQLLVASAKRVAAWADCPVLMKLVGSVI